MELKGKVAIITGGASGIGSAVARLLAQEQVKAVGVVDMVDDLHERCAAANRDFEREVLIPHRGDVVESTFRERVFADMEQRFGPVSLCVPAAGITRDRLAVKITRDNGWVTPNIYSETDFRRESRANLLRHRQGGTRRRPSNALQGSDLLRRPLCHHPPRIHRHPHGPSDGGADHPRPDSAQHPATPLDPP